MSSLNSISKELGYRDVAHLEMNLDGDIELSKYWKIIKELYSEAEEVQSKSLRWMWWVLAWALLIYSQ